MQVQLDATTDQQFTDSEGNVLVRWVLSIGLLKLPVVLNMMAHIWHSRQFVYCNDVPGLLSAMELLEGETSEDFFEVFVIYILINIIINIDIGIINKIINKILHKIIFIIKVSLQVIGYDDGRGVLKCSLNRVRKGQVSYAPDIPTNWAIDPT